MRNIEDILCKIDLNRINKIVNKINKKEKTIPKDINNSFYRLQTKYFIEKLNKGCNISDLLIDSFAICKRAIKRVNNKDLYDTQLISGIVLIEGRVAEMKTGEGKTLAEICPVYLSALSRKGVHIITVNDYLAERDYREMKPIFELLGLSVGLVVESSTTEERREAYNCDITYTTNSEIGFDYLRDNTVRYREQKVLRDLNFAIIDEIDSILLDDSRTPLLLASNSNVDINTIKRIDFIIRNLSDSDYKVYPKDDAVILTDKGVKLVERLLNINNLSDESNLLETNLVYQSLKAHYILNNGVDYILNNGSVELIDFNTGRVSKGRKLSDGLHQMIEAKEQVEITPLTKTIASITYQNLFLLYNKISGMSGTVFKNKNEFEEFYNLDIVRVPTNKVIRRVDYKDKFYRDNSDKLVGIINDIIKISSTGRPILVGTPSITYSEYLSKELNLHGINHLLLNANNVKEESSIIAKAGQVNSIIVATNIAGRGTDIKLSKEALELGGLHIIGTERSESRRVDDQLIGRAGRQGEVGSSQFYCCCDDKILKRVYSEEDILSCKDLFTKSITKSEYRLRRMIEKSQSVIQSKDFDLRKNQIKFEDVIRSQRNLVYTNRDIILNSDNLNEVISTLFQKYIDIIFKRYGDSDDVIYLVSNEVYKDLGITLPINIPSEDMYKVRLYYINLLITNYNLVVEKVNYNTTDFVISRFLKILDEEWVNHMKLMDSLKITSNNQQYVQKEPLCNYKIKSVELYNNMVNNTIIKFTKYIFNKDLNLLKAL